MEFLQHLSAPPSPSVLLLGSCFVIAPLLELVHEILHLGLLLPCAPVCDMKVGQDSNQLQFVCPLAPFIKRITIEQLLRPLAPFIKTIIAPSRPVYQKNYNIYL